MREVFCDQGNENVGQSTKVAPDLLFQGALNTPSSMLDNQQEQER